MRNNFDFMRNNRHVLFFKLKLLIFAKYHARKIKHRQWTNKYDWTNLPVFIYAVSRTTNHGKLVVTFLRVNIFFVKLWSIFCRSECNFINTCGEQCEDGLLFLVTIAPRWRISFFVYSWASSIPRIIISYFKQKLIIN